MTLSPPPVEPAQAPTKLDSTSSTGSIPGHAV